MFASFAVIASSGCVHVAYHLPPKPGRPAATVKFRIAVNGRPRVSLPYRASLDGLQPVVRIFIDGRVLRYQAGGLRAGRTVATWTRVRPGWRALEFRSWWAVRFTVEKEKTEYVEQTETCLKDKCRSTYGVGGYQQKCGMVRDLCRKRVRRTRRVRISRTIQADPCGAGARFWLRRGGTYLLTLLSFGTGGCRMACQEQVFVPEGGFRLVPCSRVR